MTTTLSYTAELEYLIINTLVPVYNLYYRDRGEIPPYTNINQSLLDQITKTKAVPRLFQPKRNES